MLPHHTDLNSFFAPRNKQELLSIISDIYQLAHGRIAWELFGDHVYEYHLQNLDVEEIYRQVDHFKKRSLAGEYYAPFAMDGKNFHQIPEATDIWLYELSLLLDLSCVLAEKGFGDIARVCLEQLTDLIDELGNDKIVFAHEMGEWMITSKFDYKGVFRSLQE